MYFPHRGAARESAWDLVNGFWSLFLAFGLTLTALLTRTAHKWRFGNVLVRQLIADYGAPLMVSISCHHQRGLASVFAASVTFLVTIAARPDNLVALSRTKANRGVGVPAGGRLVIAVICAARGARRRSPPRGHPRHLEGRRAMVCGSGE